MRPFNFSCRPSSGLLKITGQLACCFGTISLLSGCVALNIPSQRFADPDDRGGVLGHWSKERPAEVMSEFDAQTLQRANETGIIFDELAGGVPCNRRPLHAGSQDSYRADECAGGYFVGGGPLAVDPFGDYDPTTSDHGGFGPKKPKAKPAPEIPWPRYHPIPTRPVFGATAL